MKFLIKSEEVDMRLDVVAPTRELNIGEVEYIRAPTTDGYFGIMDNHIPAIIALEIGEVKYIKSGKAHFLSIGSGYAEIERDSTVLIVESFELPEEIDIQKAKKEREIALEKMRSYGSWAGFTQIRSELRLSISRLKVAEKRGGKA